MVFQCYKEGHNGVLFGGFHWGRIVCWGSVLGMIRDFPFDTGARVKLGGKIRSWLYFVGSGPREKHQYVAETSNLHSVEALRQGMTIQITTRFILGCNNIAGPILPSIKSDL